MKCASCMQTIPDDSMFCPFCGCKIDKDNLFLEEEKESQDVEEEKESQDVNTEQNQCSQIDENPKTETVVQKKHNSFGIYIALGFILLSLFLVSFYYDYDDIKSAFSPSDFSQIQPQDISEQRDIPEFYHLRMLSTTMDVEAMIEVETYQSEIKDENGRRTLIENNTSNTPNVLGLKTEWFGCYFRGDRLVEVYVGFDPSCSLEKVEHEYIKCYGEMTSTNGWEGKRIAIELFEEDGIVYAYYYVP